MFSSFLSFFFLLTLSTVFIGDYINETVLHLASTSKASGFARHFLKRKSTGDPLKAKPIFPKRESSNGSNSPTSDTQPQGNGFVDDLFLLDLFKVQPNIELVG